MHESWLQEHVPSSSTGYKFGYFPVITCSKVYAMGVPQSWVDYFLMVLPQCHLEQLKYRCCGCVDLLNSVSDKAATLCDQEKLAWVKSRGQQ